MCFTSNCNTTFVGRWLLVVGTTSSWALTDEFARQVIDSHRIQQGRQGHSSKCSGSSSWVNKREKQPDWKRCNTNFNDISLISDGPTRVPYQNACKNHEICHRQDQWHSFHSDCSGLPCTNSQQPIANSWFFTPCQIPSVRICISSRPKRWLKSSDRHWLLPRRSQWWTSFG